MQPNKKSIKTNILLFKNKADKIHRLFDILEGFPYTEYLTLTNDTKIFSTGKNLQVSCVYSIPFKKNQSSIPVSNNKLYGAEAYIFFKFIIGINTKDKIYCKLKKGLSSIIEKSNDFIYQFEYDENEINSFHIINNAIIEDKGKTCKNLDYFKSLVDEIVTALYKDDKKLAILTANHIMVEKPLMSM